MSHKRSNKVSPIEQAIPTTVPAKEKLVVAIAIAGNTRDILDIQEYDEDRYQIEVVNQETVNILNTAEFFNTVPKLLPNASCIVYIGAEFNFAHQNSLTNLLQCIGSEKVLGFGAIYSDLYILNKDGTMLCSKYHPSYDALRRSSIILNTPFITTIDLAPVFNTDIHYLCLWDGLCSITKNALLYHIPKPLFSVQNIMSTSSISTEIGVIRANRFP